MKQSITHGEKYGRAMDITDQSEADAYFEECVAHQMGFGLSTREEAEAIERSNLEYWAGYYSPEVRRRVERLFRCAHPVFGAIEERGQPSLAAAFALGLARGERSAQ